MLHAIYILFLFTLGACVGSFLNVVVWRVPRKGWASLISPPSHCPSCKHNLAWYDNVPVFGWIFLRGKCRYCGLPISPKYPAIEFITGAIFAFYYVMFFIYQVGPCAPMPIVEIDLLFGQLVTTNRMPTSIAADWPVYALYMAMFSALLAASLIDLELYIIPEEIPWAMAIVGIVIHAIIDRPTLPGALNVSPLSIAGPLAAGGALGLLVSIVLFQLKMLPMSFPEGEPVGDIDDELYEAEVERATQEGLPVPPRPRTYTRAEVRAEIRKEMLFLTPPLLLAAVSGFASLRLPAVAAFWQSAQQYHWLSGMLGAMLGAMIGGLLIWLARILGSLIMGRVAMGLGDVHFLFGIGAIIGAGAVTLTFFLAPFVGLAVGLWGLLARRRHELPYGPYLSLAAGAAVLLYCPVADHLAPGFQGLALAIRGLLGG